MALTRPYLALCSVLMFAIGHLTANIDVIDPEYVKIAEAELNAKPNGTSSAEKILEYLVENNSAVNFALKRGNSNKKQKPNANVNESEVKPSIDEQINSRIREYLAKKQERLKNVTAYINNVDISKVKPDTLTNLPSNQSDSTSNNNKKQSGNVPSFFTNAYDRVVNMLENDSNKELDMPRPPQKPTEEEILSMGEEATFNPVGVEDSINLIGSQLILGDELVSTHGPTTEYSFDTTTLGYQTPGLSDFASKSPMIVKATIKQNTIQKIGERVGELLDKIGLTSGSKKTEKPSNIPYSYEIPVSTEATYFDTSPPSKVSMQENSDLADSYSNVQSFLSQFGATVSNYGATDHPTTDSMQAEDFTDDGTYNSLQVNNEEIHKAVTTRRTGLPYRRTTNSHGKTDVETNYEPTAPNDFYPMETTKRPRRTYPTMWTSYWKRPTTQTPLRYPVQSKISSELSDAQLIDTNNENTTLVKISILNAGCHSEKSLLMLLNKKQRIFITVDTTDGEEPKEIPVSKRPNGVELQIDNVDEDDAPKLEETTGTEQMETVTATETSKPTRPTKFTTPKRTRTTRTPRTTPVRISRTTRLRTTRSKPTRPVRPVDYDESLITTATRPQKTRRTKGKKKGNKRKNKNKNRGSAANRTSSVTVVPESISSVTVPLKSSK